MSEGGRGETRAAAQQKKRGFHALPDSEIYTSEYIKLVEDTQGRAKCFVGSSLLVSGNVLPKSVYPLNSSINNN